MIEKDVEELVVRVLDRKGRLAPNGKTLMERFYALLDECESVVVGLSTLLILNRIPEFKSIPVSDLSKVRYLGLLRNTKVYSSPYCRNTEFLLLEKPLANASDQRAEAYAPIKTLKSVTLSASGPIHPSYRVVRMVNVLTLPYVNFQGKEEEAQMLGTLTKGEVKSLMSSNPEVQVVLEEEKF